MNMPREQHTIASLARLYLQHASLLAKANLARRNTLVTISFAVLFRELLNVAVAWVLVARFGTIQGWTVDELMFSYSFLFLSYALVALLFTGVRDFDAEVSEGECDGYLVKPLGVLFQVIARKADLAATLGHGLLGVALFVFAARRVQVTWTSWYVLYAALSVLGGTLIQASILLVSAAISFWTIRTTNLRNLIFFNLRRCAGFPLSVYPPVLRFLSVYVIPFAFVNYFPAQFLLGKNDGYLTPWIFAYAAPLVGMTMFALSLLVWDKGLSRYSSAGN